ncbi:MAG: MBL fold metallo-hydrolase, partial [Clostridiales bacterium]|nr:MBL fold metallo-hydrolase [Clostridiales bacterium]
GADYDLTQNGGSASGSRTPAEKKAQTRVVSTVYDRLLAAGQRLLAVIEKNREGANKDLAKFADQINALCDKWER